MDRWKAVRETHADEAAQEAVIDPATELPATGRGGGTAERPQRPSGKHGRVREVKAERDQLLDRLARLQAEFRQCAQARGTRAS